MFRPQPNKLCVFYLQLDAVLDTLSTGDTDISLHIPPRQVKTEKSQGAKICLNFNFRGWGWGSRVEGVFWASQNRKVSKCQDLPKFQFSGGRGYSEQDKTEKSQSAKICLNFNFQGGGGILGKSKLKSPKVPRSA